MLICHLDVPFGIYSLVILILQAIIFIHFVLYVFFSLNAMTLLVGHREEHPACKIPSDAVLAWLSVLSKKQVASLKYRLVWPFWCQCLLTQFVLENRH